MPGQVAVVTDSTAYLPDDLAAARSVAVVPLQVIIGGTVRDEGSGINARDVADALGRWAPVSTSRPTPQRFADAYAAAARRGACGVVSVHLSGDLSGTLEAAGTAAADADLPVRVVDTRSIGMGLGFSVLAAAHAASTGAGLDEVVAAAAERAAATWTVFYVDTLEHLRRGGRIGAAATWVGNALMMKPLLQLLDGRIVPLEKVRTSTRAIARLEELAVEEADDRFVDVAVQHLASHPRASGLAERLRERVPEVGDLHLVEVGAVIGAHVGPGALGVTISLRDN